MALVTRLLWWAGIYFGGIALVIVLTHHARGIPIFKKWNPEIFTQYPRGLGGWLLRVPTFPEKHLVFAWGPYAVYLLHLLLTLGIRSRAISVLLGIGLVGLMVLSAMGWSIIGDLRAAHPWCGMIKRMPLPITRNLRDFARVIMHCGAIVSILSILTALVINLCLCYATPHGMHGIDLKHPYPHPQDIFELQLSLFSIARRICMFSAVFAAFGGLLYLMWSYSLWLFQEDRRS